MDLDLFKLHEYYTKYEHNKTLEIIMEKRAIEIDLDTAKKWYRNSQLKELALSVYTKEELDDNYKVYDYDEILKKFEEKYPIGTVVWGDNSYVGIPYPHIITSKPYLEEWDTLVKYTNRKKIVFKSKHIYLTNVYDSRIEVYYQDDIENIKLNHLFKTGDFDYYQWKIDVINSLKELNSQKNASICDYLDIIERAKKDIVENDDIIENFDSLYDNCIKKALNEQESKDDA